MLIMSGFFITTIVFYFFYWSLRHTWWRPNIDLSYPRILMYHMVSEHLPNRNSKFNRLRVSPKEFEKQLQWLVKNKWKSMTMSELVSYETIPSKTVVLTFDDGYTDNYTNAFPLLKKYNVKATIYIVVNRHEKNWATDKDTKKPSFELNSEPMLSDEMVQEMISSKIIEIGSHTMNHANLPSLSEEQKQNEITQSKKAIEEKYGIICESFAYPFGFYDTESIQLAKDVGYTNAVTTKNGFAALDKNKYYELQRVIISGRQKLIDFKLKMMKGRNR